MSGHGRFEELAARAAMGELAPEEQQELRGHLKFCGPCRHILAETSSVAAAAFLAGAPVEDSAAKDERRSRARTSVSQRIPIVLTMPVSSRTKRLAAAGIAAAFVLGTGVGAALGLELRRSVFGTQIQTQAQNQTVAPILSSEMPRAVSPPSLTPTQAAELPVDSGALEKQIIQLQEENRAWKEKFSASNERAADLAAQLATAEQRGSTQAQEAAQAHNELAGARSELAKVQQTLSASENALDSLRFRLEDHEAKLTEVSATLDRERQMLSAGREIRDIMGARELHIVDVIDRDSKGRVKKPFGRAFYTQGKSLIFYAFDLPAKGTTEGKYVYAAWGSNSSNLNSNVAHSLGIFYNDDHAQRRWAIKFDDPKILNEIDTVFVTLEPADKPFASPTSKPILEAYFGTPPNHP